MSLLFKYPPGTFAEYEHPKSPAAGPLRDDHLVLLTIDRLLALHAAFKRWRKRSKTLHALAELDDRQLRDIGLTRDDWHYHALAGHDDIRPEHLRYKAEEIPSDAKSPRALTAAARLAQDASSKRCSSSSDEDRSRL
jgi:uncharacterized protein YjiS (DUF1127 family)